MIYTLQSPVSMEELQAGIETLWICPEASLPYPKNVPERENDLFEFFVVVILKESCSVVALLTIQVGLRSQHHFPYGFGQTYSEECKGHSNGDLIRICSPYGKEARL